MHSVLIAMQMQPTNARGLQQ